jgi:hypothetical protein
MMMYAPPTPAAAAAVASRPIALPSAPVPIPSPLAQQYQQQPMTRPLQSAMQNRPAFQSMMMNAGGLQPIFQTQAGEYQQQQQQQTVLDLTSGNGMVMGPPGTVENDPYLKYNVMRPSPHRPTTLETVVSESAVDVDPYNRTARKGKTFPLSKQDGTILLPTSYPLIPSGSNAIIEWPPTFEPDNRVYTEDKPQCTRTNDAASWGYMDDETDPYKPEFRRFNHAGGDKDMPWHEYVYPRYKSTKNKETGQKDHKQTYPGYKWISKSPEPVRLPTKFHYTTLHFELTPHYYHSMQDFCAQLKAGSIDLIIPAYKMQQYFATDHNYTKKSIIVDAMWIVEQHSTFKEPLIAQMFSKHYRDDIKQPVAWFQTSGPNTGGLSCPHVIYPETHHKSMPIPVYQIPSTSEFEEFNRWINVDEKKLRDKLMSQECNGPDPYHYSILGMADQQIHCTDMLQFLVTTEWSPRINEMAAADPSQSMEYQDHQAKINKGEAGQPTHMVVHKSILNRLVDEKFTGRQDKGLYLMRIDQDMRMEVRLKHQMQNNTAFLTEVVNLHGKDTLVSLSFSVVIAWDEYLGPDHK